MSTEENKALTRRLTEEIMNQGNLDLADELFDKDYIDHNDSGDIKSGPEGVKQFVSQYRSAFPDINANIQDQIAEGDKVVDRIIAIGTQKGALEGIAPTGKQITITIIVINRIAGGKIVESWSNMDELGLMQQLGAVPPPR